MDGTLVRWCPLCKETHDVEEFEGSQRNCRVALDAHNQRRVNARALKRSRTELFSPLARVDAICFERRTEAHPSINALDFPDDDLAMLEAFYVKYSQRPGCIILTVDALVFGATDITPTWLLPPLSHLAVAPGGSLVMNHTAVAFLVGRSNGATVREITYDYDAGLVHVTRLPEGVLLFNMDVRRALKTLPRAVLITDDAALRDEVNDLETLPEDEYFLHKAVCVVGAALEGSSSKALELALNLADYAYMPHLRWRLENPYFSYWCQQNRHRAATCHLLTLATNVLMMFVYREYLFTEPVITKQVLDSTDYVRLFTYGKTYLVNDAAEVLNSRRLGPVPQLRHHWRVHSSLGLHHDWQEVVQAGVHS